MIHSVALNLKKCFARYAPPELSFEVPRCVVSIISPFLGDTSQVFTDWGGDENRIALLVVQEPQSYIIFDRRNPSKLRKYIIRDLKKNVEEEVDGETSTISGELDQVDLKQEALIPYTGIFESENQKLKAAFTLFLRYAPGDLAAELEHCLEPIVQDVFRQSIGKHIEGPYTEKPLLLEALRIVCARLSGKLDAACGPLTASEKTAITTKLLENITDCTPGWHIRVNSIVFGLDKSSSLDALLFRVRMEMVEQVATHLNTGGWVHAYNRYFIVARAAGYGVNPPNEHDPYDASDGIQAMLDALKLQFQSFFPYTIVDLLTTALKGRITERYGYVGRRKPLESYTLGDYESFKCCLSELFQVEISTDLLSSPWFSLDEELCVNDINWRWVQKQLLSKLTNEGYLQISDKAPSKDEYCYETLQGIYDLEAFERLPEKEKVGSLTRRNGHDNYHCLMLAARYQPMAIASLVEAIKFLSVKQQSELFAQRSREGYNCLMLAVRYQPAAIPPLLEAMKSLELKQPFELFAQHCRKGYNCLMLAARYQSAAIPPLLEVIKSFELKQQFELFAQHDRDDYSCLMLATRYQSAAIPPLLEIIKSFDLKQQSELFAQKNRDDYSCLMLATRYVPMAVPTLLEAISFWDSNLKSKILAQRNKCGDNSLMLAVQYQLAAVVPLLAEIASLELSHKMHILSQTDSRGDNCLKLATHFQEAAVPPLLETIMTLGRKQKAKIFAPHIYRPMNVTDNYIADYLFAAATYQSAGLVPLMVAIGLLDEDLQLKIFAMEDCPQSHFSFFLWPIWNKHPTEIMPLMNVILTLSPKVQTAIFDICSFCFIFSDYPIVTLKGTMEILKMDVPFDRLLRFLGRLIQEKRRIRSFMASEEFSIETFREALLNVLTKYKKEMESRKTLYRGGLFPIGISKKDKLRAVGELFPLLTQPLDSQADLSLLFNQPACKEGRLKIVCQAIEMMVAHEMRQREAANPRTLTRSSGPSPLIV